MSGKIRNLLRNAKQGLFAFTLTLFSVTVYSQASYTFNHTGSMQTLTLQAGTYSVQCWGGIGGWHANDPNQTRGKSGYSGGSFTLNTTTTLYIAAGGAGGQQVNGTVPGGFNGGGNAKYYTYSYNGGGGASHVATAKGTLAS